jgi:hypothetical protein
MSRCLKLMTGSVYKKMAAFLNQVKEICCLNGITSINKDHIDLEKYVCKIPLN